jgi:hypothetical protein
MFRYQELVSRNTGLLSVEEQTKLREMTVGIAGCGMGSFVAEALCRLGVERFILVDADAVEVANFNHQAYDMSNDGENKAEALSKHLALVNPETEIEVWPFFVTYENAPDFVSKVDVVIDCIDPMPGLGVSLALSRAAKNEGKTFLYPIDVGWGAVVFCLSHAESFENLLGVSLEISLEQFDQIPVWELMGNMAQKVNLPEYFLPVFGDLVSGKLDHYPQPITAAFTAATLVLSAVVKIAKAESLPLFLQFDPLGQC